MREGDLFGPVNGERFDLILFNPPFYRGEPRDALDRAWRATDVIERFAAQLGDHLTPTGSALVILSSDGEAAAFLDAVRTNGLVVEIVAGATSSTRPWRSIGSIARPESEGSERC